MMKPRVLAVVIILFLLGGVLRAQTSDIRVLFSFTDTTGSYEGADPKGSLIMDGSTLYGFTSAGGPGGGGVIFSFDTSRRVYDVLASFASNDAMGSQPHHNYLSLEGGTIIRPLFQGGMSNNGTIFSVQENGTAPTVDYLFTGRSNSPTQLGDGSQPHSGLLAAGGHLFYGVTAAGGRDGGGVIYSYDSKNNVEGTLYAFSTNGGAGFDSHGQLVWNSSGTVLLGMTRQGGGGIGNSNTVSDGVTNSPGVIFSFNPATSQYSQLYSFTSASNTPYFTDHGILTLGTGAKATTIFGMTEYGGVNGNGTVFSLSQTGASSLTILHSFGAAHDGSKPYGSLVLNTNNGYLYGMTSAGGSSGDGTIFCINQSGSIYSVLASFSKSTGGDPIDNITFNSNDTVLYGLTQNHGSNDCGTLFELNIPQSWTNTGMVTYSKNTVLTTLSIQGGTTTVASGAILNPVNQTTVTGGNLRVNGLLVTPLLTLASGASLQGSGIIDGYLDSWGTVFMSGMTVAGSVLNFGTMVVRGGGNVINGSLQLISSSTLQINGTTQLAVSGPVTLGGTLVVMTPVPFGSKYTFLTASSISGAFSSILVPEGERGRLLIEGDPTASVLIAPASYMQMAGNRNQSNVATALNSFIPATSGDQLTVSTSLDSLSATQYNQAFNAIMPSFYQQVATIAFNQANAQNMELNQRLWGLRVAEGGGFSMTGLADNYAMLQEGQGDGSGKGVLDAKKDILRPGLDNHWGMFVDGNGIFAQANSANMLPGYNSEGGGVTAGLSYQWTKGVATGIYAGYQGSYTKSGANGSGLGTGSSLTDNAVRFGVFGTYGQENGKGFYANALAGGAYHNLRATRVIQFPGLNRTANSAPGAGELDTMLGGGYDIQKGKFTFGPTASLQYTYLGVNSVNETGAQSLDFNSSGWNSSSMLSSLGAHAAYTWYAHKGIVVVPQISLNWQHEFMQNPYAINGNLGGTSPSFSNWSAAPIRNFLYTGVGFTVEFANRWNTSFFYNAVAGNQNLTSQNIFWSAGMKF